MRTLSIKLSAIAALAMIALACQPTTKTSAEDSCENKTEACCDKAEKSACTKSKESEKTILVGDFASKAESLVDKEIKLQGWVGHVCSHSGRKCFLTNEAETAKVRVEAKGEINGFNKELAGSQLLISGVVRVNKLSEVFINEWEAKILSKQKDIEEGGKHCSAELGNFMKMKEWMKSNKKDFYPIYYVDGMKYEEIEKN